MSAIERVLRRIPYVRRPFIQRDAARAELRALKAALSGASEALVAQARKHFPDEWHFVLPQDDERQDSLIRDFRQYIRQSVGRKARALEIGPSVNPVLAKADGYNVATLDHASADELVAKYDGHDVDLRKIEPVDFVWQGEPLVQAVGHARYDAIVACHVIEHAPDFVGFLRDCADILADDGTIYLIVPDKRYCFDFFQPLSDVAKVLGDHHAGRTRHSIEAFYRSAANVLKQDAIAWGQDRIVELRFAHGDPDHMWQAAKRDAGATGYIDRHENYFTPMSFTMLIDELRYLRLIDLEPRVLTRARGCEFLATLQRAKGDTNANLDAFLARKMCAYRILMVEEMERINALRA
jgi:2-polyprenyl-3-methyl-5-hydroxy-6-metoxy-1,4-benzoquinol methylase